MIKNLYTTTQLSIIGCTQEKKQSFQHHFYNLGIFQVTTAINENSPVKNAQGWNSE